jgi:hypothetical protein
METFTEKLFRFILNTLDFEILLRSNLHLLNGSSLPSNDLDQNYYKHFETDVHEEMVQLIRLFTLSHSKFVDYLFEQIDTKKIIQENNQKIFYLLSILFEKRNFENLEEYQRILALLNQLISDENKQRKQTRKRKKDQAKKGII